MSLLYRWNFKSFCLLLMAVVFMTAGCSSGGYVKPDSAVSGVKLLEIAKSQLGLKYKYGGVSPKTGFDCSGFVMWVHKQGGITIDREAPGQFQGGKKIEKSDLKAGDIVFFETYKKGPSHVGIYDGNGRFIHSPNSKSEVKFNKLSNSYYKKRYLGARRYW